MVAANPLFRSGWSWKKKLAATVLNDVWPEVFFFTAVGTMVVTVNEFTDTTFFFKPSLLGVLGTVLGLVISFRTSSAYERYQEGRKMWTNIITFSRNLAQLIWLYVPTERPAKEGQRNLTPMECIIEKKTMINLIQAFSVSIKHYLRGESGVYYQDLYPLICFLPRYAGGSRTEADMLPMWHASEDGEHPFNHEHDHIPRDVQSPYNTLVGKSEDGESIGFFGSLSKKKRTFDPEQVLPTVHVHRPLKPSRNPPPTTVYDYVPFLRVWKILLKPFRTKKEHIGMRSLLRRKAKPQLGDSNVPIEISLFLHNYINFVIKTDLVKPASASGLVGSMTAFQDTISNLERIGNTPLPFAYQAHLRMSLWLYLFFLPFQIYSDLKWLTIPASAFASFLFLGFLEIGQEIENPFNYDLNDLDLDSFCLAIQRELHEITAHHCPDPADFIFSPWNQPFAPADRRTASEILKTGGDDYLHPDHSGIQPGMASLRRTLLQGWRDVDTHTREV